MFFQISAVADCCFLFCFVRHVYLFSYGQNYPLYTMQRSRTTSGPGGRLKALGSRAAVSAVRYPAVFEGGQNNLNSSLPAVRQSDHRVSICR